LGSVLVAVVGEDDCVPDDSLGKGREVAAYKAVLYRRRICCVVGPLTPVLTLVVTVDDDDNTGCKAAKAYAEETSSDSRNRNSRNTRIMTA